MAFFPTFGPGSNGTNLPTDQETDEILENENDEIVEIDDRGIIRPVNSTPRSHGKKPVMLRDPIGEY